MSLEDSLFYNAARGVGNVGTSIAVGGGKLADAVFVGLPDYVLSVAGANPTGQVWRDTLRNDNGSSLFSIDLKRGTDMLGEKLYTDSVLQAQRQLATAPTFQEQAAVIYDTPMLAVTGVGEQLPAIYAGGAIARALAPAQKVKRGVNLAKTSPPIRNVGISAAVDGAIGIGQMKTQLADMPSDVQTEYATAGGLATVGGNFAAARIPVRPRVAPFVWQFGGQAGQTAVGVFAPRGE